MPCHEQPGCPRRHARRSSHDVRRARKSPVPSVWTKYINRLSRFRRCRLASSALVRNLPDRSRRRRPSKRQRGQSGPWHAMVGVKWPSLSSLVATTCDPDVASTLRAPSGVPRHGGMCRYDADVRSPMAAYSRLCLCDTAAPVCAVSPAPFRNACDDAARKVLAIFRP